jgi:crossover junction endodeoxyribonuclease RusA
MIAIVLPWPPSVNHYWFRNKNGNMRVGEKGVNFRNAVAHITAHAKASIGLAARVCVTIEAHAPDKRRRDLDNLQKAILDSLTYAGIWGDDDQVDDLRIYWARDATGKKRIGGMVKVWICDEAEVTA